MTTIVYADGVFAWDTQATEGDRKRSNFKKVFSNEGVVFGVAGITRVGKLLQFADIPNVPAYDHEVYPVELAEGYLVLKLIPFIRNLIKDAGYQEEDGSVSKNNYFVWIKGHCFYLGVDFNHTIIDEFDAIGSGSGYALGALAAGSGIKDAVLIASSFSNGTNDVVYTGKAEDISCGNFQTHQQTNLEPTDTVI